jgi:hypothetical protein
MREGLPVLKGVELMEHMSRRAIRVNEHLTGSRSDALVIAEALSVAYLDGAIAALGDETKRITQEAADGLAHPETVGD